MGNQLQPEFKVGHAGRSAVFRVLHMRVGQLQWRFFGGGSVFEATCTKRVNVSTIP